MCKKHFCHVIHRRIHVRFASQEAQQIGQVFSMIIFQYKMTSTALLLYRQQPQGITSVNCDATWCHIITIEPLHHSQQQLRKSSPLLNHILRLYLSYSGSVDIISTYLPMCVCIYICTLHDVGRDEINILGWSGIPRQRMYSYTAEETIIC